MTDSSAEKVLAKARHPAGTSSHEEDTPPPYTPIATAHTATVISPAGNDLDLSKLETGRSTINTSQNSRPYVTNYLCCFRLLDTASVLEQRGHGELSVV
ncbi:6702_t:CDS:2 [Paraglomus occultum]|uniref:6702_t:CDS:1 n=1 Tax=Paraglomus occultum TaxID=144539 RepID=A0A9N9BHF0_9GLOM|nr:6702_t:CDS:2 [Paraglomus occultum]